MNSPNHALEEAFSPVESAIEDVRAGRPVLVVDTAPEAGFGCLTLAAEQATRDTVNFMLSEARGSLHLCLTQERGEQLGLSLIGTSEFRSDAAFMVSLEAREGITSGVSAEDRARTIRLAADPTVGPSAFVYPGHVPVLRARPSGVLERARQTEAAVDLARLAGLEPAAAYSEVLTEDGSAATGPELLEYARKHGLRLISIAGLVAHRRRRERLVERVASVRMPTTSGEFQAVAFREVLTNEQHVALVKGPISPDVPVLVRVHTQCLLGDVFHSNVCDCGQQLNAAAARIGAERSGILLYLCRPNGGLGLLRRMAATQEELAHPVARGADEPTDVRDYGIGSQILVELGARQIRVLTDTARDLSALEAYGLTVVEQVPVRDASIEQRGEHHQRLSLDDPIA